MGLLEAAQGMFGAWRLLHLDRTGLQYFQTSEQAFWHSFWAAALVLPADAIATLLLAEGSETANLPDAVHDVVIYLQVYAIQWVLFPLVMAGLSETLQRGERFVLFIVAWNWANIVRAAILLPAIAIFAMDGSDGSGWGAAIYLGALFATFFYAGFVARAALDVAPTQAAMVVLVEIGLAMLLWFTAESLIG